MVVVVVRPRVGLGCRLELGLAWLVTLGGVTTAGKEVSVKAKVLFNGHMQLYTIYHPLCTGFTIMQSYV